MPRKKHSFSATLFYPNQIKINTLQQDIINNHRGKIPRVNFFLFFHLLSAPYLEFDTETERRHQYLYIHSDVLRTIFRNQYRMVINDLKANDYIQVNEAYCHTETGSFSKAYRIHPRLVNPLQRFCTVHEPVDKHFLRKLETLSQINTTPDNRMDPARQHIIATTQRVKLVSSPESLAYVAQRYATSNNAQTPEDYFTYFNNNPLKRPGVDAFGRRVHSVLTNLPKVLRKCVRFDSDLQVRVVELDIINAQPFFLSAATADLLNRYVPDATEAIPIFQQYENCTDFVKFKGLCESGWIYENFMGNYAMKYGAALSRDRCKELIYICFFSDYQLIEAGLTAKSRTNISQTRKHFFILFQELFPSVYNLFKALKSFNWACTVNKKGERKPYANNALIAQRLESEIMYSRVVQSLIDHGYTEILTVHDCILVKESEAATARKIMADEFYKLGLHPQIK